EAFHSGSPELLVAVNVPGSAAAAADQRIVAQLNNGELRLNGFTSTLSDVTAEDGATGERAVVRLTSATTGYQTVNAAGAPVAAGAATAPQRLRLVLVRVDGQWRISDVLPGS
ncbi:MAG: serine/threonine protein kinase, partial [Pseudarthrobacter sp.]|nr:serine/threonine protein kinase [Pseudarthrobacter sp.]